MSRPPLRTLTGNLLAERTFTYAQWSVGKTQRASATSFQVGGKGINVAKMLARLGDPVEAWAFVGGASGEECRAWLQTQPFASQLFPSRSPTRTGLVVRSADERETTFLGPDAPVDEQALAACAAALGALPDGGVLALCGSFPGWDHPAAEPLRLALAAWAQRGILYVDTYGPPLAWALGQPAALIKINREEFDAFCPATGGSLATRLAALRARSPVRAWVITDGPQPVQLSESPSHLAAVQPPSVQEVSATGSGDVFLAALMHAREFMGCGLTEAVQFALPYGAANAAHPGIAEFDLNTLPAPRSLAP